MITLHQKNIMALKMKNLPNLSVKKVQTITASGTNTTECRMPFIFKLKNIPLFPKK